MQVICEELKNIPVLIRFLRFYCLPLKLRIGIGIGPISYISIGSNKLPDAELALDFASKLQDIPESMPDGLAADGNDPNKDISFILDKYHDLINPWDMNGIAFYRAREALDEVKGKKEISTRICMDKSEWELAIQTILNLIDVNINQWSESKWKSIQMYDEYGTYEKAGRVLNITFQAIQKNCDSANWNVIKSAESNLAKIFESFKDDYEKDDSNGIGRRSI